MKTADLHTHTLYSDGTETPRRVVELAAEAGLSALAITDHDILDGCPEAAAAAAQRGLELIPGLEMSASDAGREVHVLGFFIDADCAPFQQLLADQRTRRVQRIHEMIQQLGQIGLAITPEEVFGHALGQGSVGRPHVAKALLKRGYVSTLKEAFDRYIGNGGPAYIPGSPLHPRTAIQGIREAGGIPVLAHPIYLKDDTLIDQLARDGLAGLEVYHSGHPPEAVQRYERIADRLGLLRTGGSDYHGASKEGVAIGARTIPYDLVEVLKQWKARHPSSSCA
ncbi:MAG: PHP domain-containing protein [Candidatus Omnitrophica bacterium]|nr:PHP domain-containing protein [Candidatus Omnitrophota bacterium]